MTIRDATRQKLATALTSSAAVLSHSCIWICPGVSTPCRQGGENPGGAIHREAIVEFRLLGPIELWVAGRRCKLGTTKERCVLASLLLTPGRPVPAETLIDRLWDQNLPAKPHQSLYTYVTRLRKRLADIDDVDLPSRSGGYLLQINDDAIDLHRFRTLRAQARAIADSGDTESALELHGAATRLWRGEPLADLSGAWVARVRKSMEDELLAATFERVEIELSLGRHADLVGELSDLLARFPWVEKLAEQLMVALFRCGRQAEALAVFRRASGRIVKELGTDAWPGLQRLHQRILRGDPSLLHVPPTQKETVRSPNTLPRDIRTFTARHSEIEKLLLALPHHQAATTQDAVPTATVLAIDGMPGVGKTALAIHLAHRLADDYPDGQLFVDLHAHDPGQRPAEPATALDTLLRTLGITPARIPRTLDDRSALWRTQLAHLRALIVFDDAAGRDQILPLLPGSSRSLIIITSRRSLSGLEDIHSLSLDVLPPDEAALLLSNIVGPDRRLDDHDVDEVVRHCGHLPLAIQIAGSRLRYRPSWNGADLLARLTLDNHRLEELRTENRAITTVFEMSYRGLSPRQQRAFRLCSLHPGPDFTAHGTAAIMRLKATEAERILEDLLDRHLIYEPIRGRYRYHDLLHEYALQCTSTEDAPTERRAAIDQLLDYYLSIADKADRLLYPHRRRIDVTISHSPPYTPLVHTESRAREWLATEHGNLLSVARHAALHGRRAYAAQIAHVLAEHLESNGHWEAATDLHQRAVAAWREIADGTGLAFGLAELSAVQLRTGHHGHALEAAAEALAIYRSSNDLRGQADLLEHIGRISLYQSDFTEALRRFEEAHLIRCGVGDRRGEANALNHIASALFHSGRYQGAHDQLHRALAIYRSIGDRRRQTIALNNIGEIEMRLGHYETAQRCYEEAADASEMSRQHKAIWQNNMGNVHKYKAQHSAALEYYRKALETYREIGDRRCQAGTLINIGSIFQRTGHHREALIHHQKALVTAEEIGERFEASRALRHIGEVYQQTGRYATARENFVRAHDLARQINDPYEQARALDGIGMVLFHTEGATPARRHWQDALKLYEQIGVPEAEESRQRLRDLI
jgi:tetratricopeptide (TPR) repeat protein/DNA-binding SARP family transcriptional activator